MRHIVNIGVIGCANIAKRSVIPAILELPDHFNLVGIASRKLAKAKSCAEGFKTNGFDGYQTLLDQSRLHAVYIPLPNSLHFEWVKEALIKGLHVLVEKSLACSCEDVNRLNMLAKEKKLVLIENFQFRFHSQLQLIKRILGEGKIGDLRYLRSSFGFPGLTDPNDIRYQKVLGGGALLDAGAYPVKISQIFLGEEIEIKAANLNYIKNKEVDIWGGAYVKQKNGNLFGELAFGFNQFYQCNLELLGSKGKIVANRIFTAPPDYESVVELENSEGTKNISLPADNHFKNMLKYFHYLIYNEDTKERIIEYNQNVNQARLINEIQIRANE